MREIFFRKVFKTKHDLFKSIRNETIYYLCFFLFTIFKITPWKLNVFFGSLLGKLFFYFDSRYKYKAFKNLKLVFPSFNNKDIINITKNCYSNLGKNLFEFFLFPVIRKLIDKIVEFRDEDLELLKNLLSYKRGLVIFSAHFGNWELLGASLSLKGIPLAPIVRNIYIDKINTKVTELRRNVNQNIITRGKATTVKDLLKALKYNYAIGVLIDQNIKGIKSIDVPFIGKNAPTPVSFIEVVIKYNIPSVLALILRKSDNTHYVMIFPIDKKYYADTYKFAQFINDKISEYIKKYPSQWVWFHNRWNYV